MKSIYIIYSYEPLDRFQDIATKPYYTLDVEMAKKFIRDLSRRRELIYVDILHIGETLRTASTSNEASNGELEALFDEFEKGVKPDEQSN